MNRIVRRARPARLRLARYALALGLGVVLAAQGSTLGAQTRGLSAEQKLDSELRHRLRAGRRAETRRVIVRMTPGAAPRVQALLKALGQRVGRYNPSINAFTVDAADAERLAQFADVETISLDAEIRAHQAAPGTLESGRTMRGTLGLGGEWTGAGVGVAVIDSGLAPTADFRGRIRAFYDFTRGGVTAAPSDEYGHGTHVAGLIGGSGALSGGALAGVAPGVHFVGMKVLDANGQGRTSDVIAAIEYATANRQALGIDVINLSLGHPPYESAATDPLVLAVEAAVRAGIVVVSSAGNYGRNPETGEIGYTGIASPGNAPSALTVGALRTEDTVTRVDDRVPGYSSRGPTYFDGLTKPDVVAPGHRLVAAASTTSTLYMNYPELRVLGTSDWDYLTLSGTSMSTGVISGVVAQMLEAHRAAQGPSAPALTPNAIKAVLQYTASSVRDDVGADYDALTQGAGAVNAAGAIALSRAIRTDTPYGQVWVDPAVARQGATVIGGETVVWGTSVVWGNTVVWGNAVDLNRPAWSRDVTWGNTKVWGSSSTLSPYDAITWGNNVVWGNAIIWGNTVVWGNAIIWGNTVVWGNAIIWGNTVVWGNALVGGE